MLRITAIQKAKKGGYHLFIEEEYALTISAEVLAETGLAVGQQITPQRLDEIRQICDRRRARERALYLLESRSHSENTITRNRVRQYDGIDDSVSVKNETA